MNSFTEILIKFYSWIQEHEFVTLFFYDFINMNSDTILLFMVMNWCINWYLNLYFIGPEFIYEFKFEFMLIL